MSYPPHLNRLPQLPPGIRPPHFAGFPQGVPAGTPMIPVHMGIMTSAPTVLVPTTVSMVQKPPAQRKELNPVRAKEIQDGGSGGPTTTVFVGNISEKASDMLVRQLLAKCGLVLSWKRVQGASGKLQAFGFCEYKEPESTLRSLRLLHELLLGDKKLLVKVDAKTKAQLEEWKAKKRSANGGAMSEDVLKEEEEEEEEEDLDEDTKRRDQIVKGAIEGLIREHGSELNAPSQDGDNQPRKKKREKKEEEDINVMEMEDDKRDLISREISKFRDTHKKLEEEKGKKEQERQEIDKDRRERDKERERERERRDREREKEKERNDNNNKDRDRDRDRDRIDRERERTKERERERERGERERGERERGERERGERERVKERSREDSKDRSRSREPSRDEKKHDREEDQEEAYERRKLERKMRDKETAYQERLKNWEIRERKKARDYDKENQREEERRHEMTKEGKRLKEFLEDYDDDRDESKYYRGSALQKRLRDREKETELDDRDRKREKEEHDQIRQRLLAEGHPDPEAELQRMEEEAERRRQPPVKPEPEEEVQQEKPNRDREHREREHREHREREHHRDRRGGGGEAVDRPPPEHPQSQSDDDVEDGEELDDRDGEDSSDARTHPHLKPTLRPITSAPSVSSGSGGATPNSPGNESLCGIIIPHENSPEAQPTDEHRPKIGLSLKLGAGASPNHQIHTASKRKKLSNVDSVFNKFGEEEADEAPRKRKLVPLDYGEDDKSLGLDGAEVPGGKGGPNTEEKRKHIRSLIEKIPTARPELFNYPLDWTAVDSTLMDRRIRPWINKKIIEYIGEEEATLVDFVCSKVMSHGTPQGILDDVAMVLDEEAEVFIVKMWRLLIYETEAKKIGLGK
ncbi:RNA-binding protein 25-like isoform X2 [Salvelinus alpinus]|uniref:RNA-binding protein 25-like isoform X2 n=1 Tax=Salvelinus alpinus TaxID=8036 RepID=UPI0039FD1209